MKKIIIALAVSVLSAFFLTGCDEVQIFEEKKDPTKLQAYDNNSLIDDTYYVKNGTKFYQTLQPKGSASSISYVIDESRIAPAKYESLIPTYYKDEVLAYYSKAKDIDSVELERMKDLGYSFGFYNCTYNGGGLILKRDTEHLVPETDAYEKLHELKSPEIEIVAINGQEITRENYDPAGGVIIGLEKDTEYVVSFYEGTKYHEETIKADTLMLQSYELYFSDSITPTSNGYIEYTMPSDMENGYYNVNGRGIFKYLNYKKGEQDDAVQDLNISYYKTEADKLAAYSRQYSINIPNRVKDLSIQVKYKDNQEYYTTDLIKGIVIAPNGISYEMKVTPKIHSISLDLDEASAGKWTVNIIPKVLYIDDVEVDSNELAESYTLDEQEVTFENDEENIVFKIPVDKKGDVFGSIISPDGSTWELEFKEEKVNNNKINYYLYYEIPYIKAGTYKTKVYHDPVETNIGKLETYSNYVTDTEVIIIDG